MIRPLRAVSLLGLLACAACSGQKSPPADARAPRTVRYVTVADRPITAGLSLSGKLVSREEAAVAPQLSGYQIRTVQADQGQYVRAGQVLAVLDDTLLRSEIAQQEAVVTQAEVAADKAREEAARVSGLDDSGALSGEALSQRRLAVRTAEAQLAQARAQLADKRVRQGLMIIRAPVSGRILGRSARPGDVASPSSVMFRIARDGLVELDAEAPEQNLALIRPGEAARVTLAGGATVIGRVRLVGSEIDGQSRLGRARITLPRADDIRSGGFATAVLTPGGGPVRTVAEAAVGYGAEGASVTLIGHGDKIETRPVRVGRRGGGYVELIDGPPSGTRVLLKGQSFVLDGDVVRAVAAASGEAR